MFVIIELTEQEAAHWQILCDHVGSMLFRPVAFPELIRWSMAQQRQFNLAEYPMPDGEMFAEVIETAEGLEPPGLVLDATGPDRLAVPVDLLTVKQLYQVAYDMGLDIEPGLKRDDVIAALQPPMGDSCVPGDSES